ncbi:MAG: ABC transporter substrate-binding protein [Candidatus Thermofonsia Clade 1 bacterium]|jgi:trehalose/maltose transport system substrate-binding protein|uniref:ABC transporter substrate-binding protein n=1 Tax=Candidatus Thermofonsia Clade 1 bacterium TaxID=2364210 RepID=A0A2M8PFH2_9CHLR|nr:MAG: ABC transporter substrate-binding protein [Candidatus Thermofonsia Clade 1 bacterium]
MTKKIKFLTILLIAAFVLGGVFNGAALAQSKPTLRVFYGSVGDIAQDEAILKRWADENNVNVEIVYASQSATEYLAQLQQLLAARSTDIDLIQFDVIWPGILAPNMLDLGPALEASGMKDMFYPRILANNTVDGKVVGLPWFTDAGLLYYRTDLLEKYGFSEPPKTWDELEQMAKTIQDGERAAGNAEFWGFVWQGNAYEGLTCDALEWVFSNGGGSIVEVDKTISINNEAAIKAIERAARWVGTISPEGVTTYQEEDARRVFQAGNAAFMRNWPYAYVLGQGGADGTQETAIKDKFAVTALPAGDSGKPAAALGGWQLGVSAYSTNPELATQLALWLTAPEQQKERWLKLNNLPTMPAIYQDPDVLKATPWVADLIPVFENATPRPSTVTAALYNDVSVAFFTAVHDVLTKKKDAATALEDLELQLENILGSDFKVGPPPPIN